MTTSDAGLNLVTSQGDIDTTALCMWREARGEGMIGMDCVAWTIRNRCLRRHTAPCVEVMRKWQFSSMSDPKDPQLHLMPPEGDKNYAYALLRAEVIMKGLGGNSPIGAATMYYSDTIPFPPSWDKSKLEFVAKIGHHSFYVEL